jgi:hypothetical protein
MRIAFDFDGVLALTPFGRLAVHAPQAVAPIPPNFEQLYAVPAAASPLRIGIEYLRFRWRGIAPDAAAVLRELSARHELYIVTGRSRAGITIVRGWVRRHGLDRCIKDVHMAPPGLRPPQHKLAIAKLLGIDAHIDDDPRTAYHLARSGVRRVYLLDHAGAHGDAPPPDGLALVRSLREFAHEIARVEGTAPER